MKGITLGEDGDLALQVVRDSNGLITDSLIIDNTDYQNIDFVVIANKGEFKEHPILGVGAERYLKSVGRADELRREIAVQIEAIGYGKADVKVSETGKIEIDV